MKFLIISPVRNEEKYIRITIECMIKQTLLPVKWVIVNDGSNDGTGSIVEEYVKSYSFINHIKLQDRGYRKPGGGVVNTFYEGLRFANDTEYDVISKFDGDLEFPCDLLENISKYFSLHPNCGVAGPVRYEPNNANVFCKIIVPRGFVGGPQKFYRKACFKDIGGLIPRAGWDGVDTIRANMAGWETGEIQYLRINHLKPTGSAKGEGLQKACEKYGDVSYYMGGYFWYFILRVIGRSVYSRNIKVGYYMLIGYFRSKYRGSLREDKHFRNHLKKVQVDNVLYYLKLSKKMTLR
jgi:glycosyltransferase involved in cell wall biosynthesis